MSIELHSEKLFFRELTYKLKKDSPGKDGLVQAKITINFSETAINTTGVNADYATRINFFLDTDDMFFQGSCDCRAILSGIPEETIEERRKFIEDNIQSIGNIAIEFIRVNLNKKINEILSMTVTAPSERVDFWPASENVFMNTGNTDI